MSDAVFDWVLRLYCAAQISIMLARKLAPPPPIDAALAGPTPATLASEIAAIAIAAFFRNFIFSPV
jgi:hypothetical protein